MAGQRTTEMVLAKLKLVPELSMQYSHYSRLSGLPDLPENYHIVTIALLTMVSTL